MTRPTRPWHGVLVATALPLRPSDAGALAPDFDGFAEHVAWLAAQGCHGLTPNGSLGEYQTLTPDERARVVTTAVAHVYLAAPGSTARHSRHAMAIHPGWFDRSPCGTGTSARMAQLHARGELPLRTDFDNESFIGTHFIGRLVEETAVGDVPAVVPTITGRAWITGTAQYFLDSDDPFPEGFDL